MVNIIKCSSVEGVVKGDDLVIANIGPSRKSEGQIDKMSAFQKSSNISALARIEVDTVLHLSVPTSKENPETIECWYFLGGTDAATPCVKRHEDGAVIPLSKLPDGTTAKVVQLPDKAA